MTARVIRLAIVGALFVGLLPGPALAFCSSVTKSSCCCSKHGCPMRSSNQATGSSCCKPAQPVPAPVGSGSGENSVPFPTSDSPAVLTLASAPRPVPSPVVEQVASHGLGHPGVGLFTLHAAFLI